MTTTQLHQPTDRVFCNTPEGDYDARCSACWLGFAHNFAWHWLSIALHEIWGKKTGQWTSQPADNDPAMTGYVRYHFCATWLPGDTKLAKMS